MFKVSISNLILRYDLMIVATIIALYTHQTWLILLPFIIAVMAILGIRFNWTGAKKGKMVPMKGASKEEMRKAG